VSLTAQQPLNNVIRTTLQALSAVLGSTNSLHTNSLDEALALPTAEAATLALRTQQILAYETGVTNSVDPFAGSYFVERLTRDLEEGSEKYFNTIDKMGGMIPAIERGYPQREIAESAYRFQQDVERKRQLIVGVNEFVSDADHAVPTLHIDEAVAARQLEKADRIRRTRNKVVVDRALGKLKRAAAGKDNTMPPLLDAVRAYATVGEMCDALREVWGEYQEQAII
jgi:methylmalonyl-CoA mutase N-terminal domain/subunit